MGALMVEIWDATGNKKVKAELPDDEAVNRILILLIDRMSLPRFTPDGQLMSYKFHHKASGRQLLDDESLRQAGVQAGDVLRIQPEITAGIHS
ncbi:MAG TPA: EsaB/YukD family protein [Candidatus Ozemobacteraceae bacterium]|nr:EsaB/YukD family protein [Candidatus Ozemobacteraceae bacterium]